MKYLKIISTEVQIKEFISFWSANYKTFESQEMRDRYNDNICFNKFSIGNINKLFIWKNGIEGKIAKNKNKFPIRVIENIATVNLLKNKWEEETFNEVFKPNKYGAIWNSFLMHIINPNKFPIFDQHVYRAFLFLKEKPLNELKGTNKIKFEIYRNEYIPFFNTLKSESGCSVKTIDEAMWAYGKFISTYSCLLK